MDEAQRDSCIRCIMQFFVMLLCAWPIKEPHNNYGVQIDTPTALYKQIEDLLANSYRERYQGLCSLFLQNGSTYMIDCVVTGSLR